MATSSLQWSDTWILVALLTTTKEGQFASLRQLINAADYVNHAVISRDDLEAGFGRLVPLGHVIIGSSGYAASKEIHEFWRNNTYPGGPLDKFWDELSKHVGASTDRNGPFPKVDIENFVSKADYTAAVRGHWGCMLGFLALVGLVVLVPIVLVIFGLFRFGM